jgi:predicted membrane metal-binding protein
MIMGILGLIALYFERKSLAINSLLFSAVIMSLFNPMSLFYDVGFQLSF